MGEYTCALVAHLGTLSSMQTGTLNSRTPPRTEPTSAPRVVIVADDLTGACDSGVAFLASGRPVRVMLHPPASDSEIECPLGAGDIVSYTTETRNLSEEQAGARTAEVVAAVACAGEQSILFKKVAPAARGNLR